MTVTRSDLDGQRLVTPGSPDIWLVFHGERHRVPSSRAYDNLFNETERLITSVNVEEIKLGVDLEDAVCLVRPEGGHEIYLVTGSDEGIKRYHIENYDSFLDFGFDSAKIREVPDILIRAVEPGAPLTSPPQRG